MNLTHQQDYLVAMGITYYVPRWPLPFAAQSPDVPLEESSINSNSNNDDLDQTPVLPVAEQASDLLQDMLEQVEKNYQVKSVSPPSISQTQPILSQTVIPSFNLSVWRPTKGFLIIASRNGKAVPTELLANNIFRYYFRQPKLKVDEEILRWPAIDNVQLMLTEMDARTELQTWLSVQHELQTLEQIWFFGEAWQYFVTRKETVNADSTCELMLGQTRIFAKCFPDLTEILINPQLKADVLSCL